MIYIDFDGVILDTEPLLFEEWRKNPDRIFLPEIEKIKYIQNQNWENIVNNSEIINNSIYYLKNINPNDAIILTRIHSLENEGVAKVTFLRKREVKQNIIFVPFNLKKSLIVNAKDNVLVDDSLFNLDEWVQDDGIAIFFDKNNSNYDNWHKENTNGYQRILSLKNVNMFKNSKR